MTTTDASALEREVVELHGVIEGWFAGTRPRTAESYAGFADFLTLDFTSVSPNGSSSSRDVVVSGLEAAHGAYPGITVEIRRFKFVATSAELGVARAECTTAVNDASICCWCYVTIRPSAPARSRNRAGPWRGQ